jgi:hypothetical protein
MASKWKRGRDRQERRSLARWRFGGGDCFPDLLLFVDAVDDLRDSLDATFAGRRVFKERAP